MKKYMSILLALLMLASLCACGTDLGEASVQSVAMICGLGGVGSVDRFAGVTTSMGETKIQKSETQTVASIAVEVGDKVSAGDVLFTYDTERTRLDLERAKLDLDLLRNTLADQQKQKEQLEKDKQFADSTEQLNYSLEIREMDAKIQESAYNIKLKEQEVTKLSNQVSNADVTSPINGSIKAINENGGYDDYGQTLPFMSIVETDGFRVLGYVNEANMNAISIGQSVILRSRTTSDIWRGTITTIDWDNPTQNNNYYSDMTTSSSKYPFYIDLDSSENLMLGQHLYIEPDYGQEENTETVGLLLPAYYIADLDGNPYVWAQDKGGKLEKRHITLGVYDELMDSYEITSGLEKFDYIAYPDDTLQNGMTCVTYDESTFSDDFYSDDMPMDMPMGIMPDFSGEMEMPMEGAVLTEEASAA